MATPLMNKYTDLEKQAAVQQKIAASILDAEKAKADVQAQQRKDSFDYYIRKSNSLKDRRKTHEAVKQLDYAATFANGQFETDQIEKEKNEIKTTETINLVKAGKYKDALPVISTLLLTDPANSNLRYHQAMCYSKTGDVQEAVNTLKPLIQSGNPEAEKLHNKINPIRKRVAYYVTRCWDGSTSGANGSGACSHHGGVKTGMNLFTKNTENMNNQMKNNLFQSTPLVKTSFMQHLLKQFPRKMQL
ncbi:tetratricopeptide repeat protein [Paraflavitalea speifideaquila]|uniref:tetratricopeptide repeat protein n=1 Tax=Paraflavitalea speifideaquila TaxID=3076558 RepID=UPI0028E682A7|nr:tetratricopeptide repeat protein [Paraflavitalea speifideiaquila]